jgi:hypothetical protein
MKRLLAVCAAVATLAACERRGPDAGEAGTRRSADTVVTERQMQDTTIVRHDTTITTDTVRKRGTRPVEIDTVRRP